MKLFFDIETQNTFEEVDNGCDGLLVSVVGAHRDDTGEDLIFTQGELHKLENLFIDANLIIGFNIKRFDLLVLEKYFSNEPLSFPILDLFEEPTAYFGHRVSLNGLAAGTLGIEKSGTGLKAVQLYADGKLDELKRYCLNDVLITKKLYDYGVEHGELLFLSNNGKVKSCPVTWAGHKAAKPAEIQRPLFGF